MEIVDQTIDVAGLAQASLRKFDPLAQQKEVELTARINGGIPVRLFGDSARLDKLISNLVGLAVQLTDSGSIQLGVKIVDRRLYISVAGTRIGDKDRALFFEELAQAEAGVTAMPGENGPDIKAACKLVEAMEGKIGLEDESSDGTTILVELPLQPAGKDGLRIGKPAVSSGKRAEAKLAGKRVLLAEDNDVNQMLMKAMAERLGLEMDIAENGAQAVEMARRADQGGEPYDLVLMDFRMPVMDGFAATRQIRAEGISPEDLPIIAVTANAYQEDIDACFEAGMQAHLAKPISLALLTETLESWMSASRPNEAADGEDELMAGLRQRYDTFKQVAFAQLDLCYQSLPTPDADDIAELRRLMHQLSGTAAAFGEDEVGEQARELEDAIERYEGGDSSIDIGRVIADAREWAIN